MEIKIIDNETIETLIITASFISKDDNVNIELSYKDKNKYELMILALKFVENIEKLN